VEDAGQTIELLVQNMAEDKKGGLANVDRAQPPIGAICWRSYEVHRKIRFISTSIAPLSRRAKSLAT
jgi:hypothetical protein